jgi:NAD(P)-dependent dehydrogenase (short-subunit alcohol dehydrogenase family)
MLTCHALFGALFEKMFCRSVKSAVDGFIGRNVPLHCLINNAGVGAPKGQLGERTPEDIEVIGPTLMWQQQYCTVHVHN